jgi:hypothetical protein
MFSKLRNRIAAALNRTAARLATITVKVDDSPGWNRHGGQPNDRTTAEIAELYKDALEATRKNPLAKSIVNITTDFSLGDGINISSPHRRMNRFIEKFWNHPLNRIDQRLQSMSDELSRAGDLFIVLFRNPQDGMSYVRFVTKDQIVQIDTAENDWETEIAYHQITENPAEPKIWLGPAHPDAADSDAIMIHYAINRPVGAGFGEGDLDTAIPWLLRYSRMLEDRVRLNWAVRAYLWFVTVPTHLVERKQAEYATPPESGSIVVKDDGEEWEVQSPTLRASDAKHDLQAVRHMIDAIGYPPHWRGESGDANLATATAMQLRPERHLRRRQNYLVFILQDLIYQSFIRAAQIDMAGGSVPRTPFHRLFNANVSDISRQDNEMLARSSQLLSDTFKQMLEAAPTLSNSTTFAKIALRLIYRFAGEPQEDETLNQILVESGRTIEDIDDTNLSRYETPDDRPMMYRSNPDVVSEKKAKQNGGI